MRSLLQRFALWLSALALLGLAAGSAIADVSVSPTLVLFDGEAGTKAITVKNTGAKEQIFRVSLINLRMASDGSMTRADTPVDSEHFATGMVRFSPRELTLAPGASDVVRLHVAQLPPGEYRTHVLVQQVPDVEALQAPPFEQTEGMTMELHAVFGVAVPLFIREKDVSATVSFGEAHLASLPDGSPAVSLRVERTGGRSVRGALSLRRGGREIGLLDGLSIYAPTPYRDVLVPVDAKDITALSQGKLEASFQEPEDVRNPVMATAAITLR